MLGLAASAWALDYRWLGEAMPLLEASKVYESPGKDGASSTWEVMEGKGLLQALPGSLADAGALHHKGDLSIQQRLDGLRLRQEQATAFRPDLALQKGYLLIKSRQFLDAARSFYQVLAKDPTSLVAQEGLAFSLLSLGDHEGGRLLYQALISASEVVPPSYRMNYGAACFHVGRMEEAVRNFKAFAEGNPTLWKGAYNLGAALLDARMGVAALSSFQNAEALAPEKPFGVLGQLWVYRSRGNPSAYEGLQRQLVSRMGAEDAQRILSGKRLPVFLVEHSRRRNGVSKVDPALFKEFWFSHLVKQAGWAEKPLMKDLFYREALSVNPANEPLLASMYNFYKSRNEPILGGMVALNGLRVSTNVVWQKTWADVKDFIEGERGNFELLDEGGAERERVKFHIVESLKLSRSGEFRAAEVELRKVLSAYPLMKGVLANLGKAYMAQNDLNSALNLYNLGLLFFPENKVFNLNYGVLLSLNGATELGLKYLEELAMKNPEDTNISDALASLRALEEL